MSRTIAKTYAPSALYLYVVPLFTMQENEATTQAGSNPKLSTSLVKDQPGELFMSP